MVSMNMFRLHALDACLNNIKHCLKLAKLVYFAAVLYWYMNDSADNLDILGYIDFDYSLYQPYLLENKNGKNLKEL